jgi:DNA invertase Pin-like site-specific DNA recombinase
VLDRRHRSGFRLTLAPDLELWANGMAGKKNQAIEAVGYLRTSSAANVGSDKDSEQRQRVAIGSYAKAAGVLIVDWFYDAAVSGADPVEARPGFAAMLARIAGNGVRTIVVEAANRFARDLMVQESRSTSRGCRSCSGR